MMILNNIFLPIPINHLNLILIHIQTIGIAHQFQKNGYILIIKSITPHIDNQSPLTTLVNGYIAVDRLSLLFFK